MRRHICISVLAVFGWLLSLGQAPAQQYAFTNYAGQPGAPGATDGTLAESRFNQPSGLAVDAEGHLFIAHYFNHTIRRVSTNGLVSTVAGTPGQSGFVDGPAAEARFNQPSFLTFDAAGNLYVSELLNNTIRKITKAGVVSTYAGGPGQFNRPAGLAFDTVGNLFVADSANHVIRLVTPGGLVLTLAGSVGDGGTTDGPAASARFYYPTDVTFDAAGNLFISDAGNDTIRKISPAGTVSTVAGAPRQKAAVDGFGGAARFYQPGVIRFDAAGHLVVADSGNYTLRRISPAGDVTTIAGVAGQSGTADGIGTAARFFNLGYIAFNATGTLFVADVFNHRISRGIPGAGLPRITDGPASLTIGSASTTLTVTATGNAPLTYQWRLNGTNLPNATVSLSGILGRQYRVDVAEILNATTNWLTLTNLTLTTNPTVVHDPASAGVTNRYYRAVLLP